MKKLLVILTVIGSSYTATSFANNITPAVVTQSLQTFFTGAKEASWSVVNNLYKAEFVLDAQTITAYFDAEGTLVASARNITASQLPILLQADLKKEYANYVVANTLELDNEDGVTYYVTVQNGSKTMQLKSIDYGAWTVFQKK